MENDSLKVSLNDLYTLEPDSLLALYKVGGFLNRMVTKQKIKFMVNNASFGSFFIGKLTWAVILLMPLLALTMKLLYIRRDFYYVEHLIFSIHTHTMAFILFIIALALEPWVGENFGPIFLTLLALAGLYVLIAQKRYYKQKWLKTLLKFSILQVLYNILIVIVLILTLVAGFFLF